jgi:hypothetical protein
MRHLASWLVRVAPLAATIVVASACGATQQGAADRLPVVRVSERDFHIAVSPRRIASRDVRLVMQNHGPDTHELIIVRAGRSGLPLRLDGLTVNEEALKSVATVEGTDPGTVEELRLHLKRGRYELFCNMAGHFMAGMHAELVVQ